jgi:hypothetical protein
MIYQCTIRLNIQLWCLVLLVSCADMTKMEQGQAIQKTTSNRVADDFNQNQPISDVFFLDTEALSEQGIQLFLERSPYGRSWLADYQIDGHKASTIIRQVSSLKGLNPILLLSRMQVEASLISSISYPDQYLIDRAMGCGCPDGRACERRYLGLKNQISCAAQKFRELYDKSVDGSGWWRKGLSNNTLDHYQIVPVGHATAALYAYTPWVLKGSGGTWLAWRTAKLFQQHIHEHELNELGDNSWSSSSSCGLFSDVPNSHPGLGYIEAAVHEGWLLGCGNNQFCPNDSLTRAQAASILKNALNLESYERSNLSDIREHWARVAIEAVVSEGIMSGCQADRFCPEDILTRAQAAMIIAKAGHLENKHNPKFQDVPNDHWAADAIAALDEMGYIGGCSADDFCLEVPMRRWLYVTWLAQTLSLDKNSCP